MSKPTKLACFKSGSLSTDGKTLPERLLVVPWGSVDTNQGKVTCNELALAVLKANQDAAKYDRVALDFSHNTVPGTEHYQGEPAKIAALGSLSIEQGRGIFLTDLEWTPEGKEHALGGHYPDISPAVKRNDAGEVFFVHSVALCRQGEVDGLTLFSADIKNEHLMKTSLNDLDPAAVRATVNVFRVALGLPEIAEGAAADAITAGTTEAIDKITAMAKAGQPASADTTALSARMDAIERNGIIALASSQGKVIPLTAEQIAATPVTTLSAMVEKLPVTVPVSAKTSENAKDLTVLSADGKTTAEMQSTLNRMGLSDDDFKKYGPKA
jgi:phage I-like protein